MSTEEVIKEYKEKICPRCVHYVDKDYEGCNITMNIDHEANCINYINLKILLQIASLFVIIVM